MEWRKVPEFSHFCAAQVSENDKEIVDTSSSEIQACPAPKIVFDIYRKLHLRCFSSQHHQMSWEAIFGSVLFNKMQEWCNTRLSLNMVVNIQEWFTKHSVGLYFVLKREVSRERNLKHKSKERYLLFLKIISIQFRLQTSSREGDAFPCQGPGHLVALSSAKKRQRAQKVPIVFVSSSKQMTRARPKKELLLLWCKSFEIAVEN